MIAVKSLNGGYYHYEGEVEPVKEIVYKYTSKRVECVLCKGVGTVIYKFGGVRGDEPHACYHCNSRGWKTEKTRTGDSTVKDTIKIHSLCGTAVLRPKTKANTRERATCLACERVRRVIDNNSN